MAEQEGFRLPPSVISALRDLAVAFLLVAIVFAALFAFARTWPPMVVVESGSMQHSDGESFVGVVDTGDIVVVQEAPRREEVVTYVQGRAAGHATYGDFGDVIVFRNPSMVEATPIIHRAILYLQWNATVGGFDVPTLLALDPSLWEVRGGEPWALGPDDWIRLHDVGFRGLTVEFRLQSFHQQADPARCPEGCSGYVTMGDNNAPGYDQRMVPQAFVLGRARGELPWFGLLKLVFSGTMAWGSPQAPANSWTSLTVALVLLVAGPVVLDIGLTLLDRRREEAEEPNPDEETAPDDEAR